MCGILFKSKEKEKKRNDEILKLLNHRGPDYSGSKFILKDGVYLGHTRLKILDLSELSSQPMTLKESPRYELLFNGEIYNYKELKLQNDLKTISSGDTEVVYRFLASEKGNFDELDGEFAIVFYDRQKGIVYFARDPLGVKQLYYWIGEKGEIAISSEIKPLLEYSGRFFNSEFFRSNFLYFGYSNGEETLFKGIKKIPPGSFFAYDLNTGELKKEKFHTLKERPNLNCPDEIRVRNSVIRAVEKRLISDVPISLTLSGGIDSSVIASIVAKNNKNVKAYSLGIGKNSEDLKYSRIVAEYLGIDLTEIEITEGEVFKSIHQAISIAEEPFDKGSLLPTYFLGNAINEKVVLVGEGADECFGGYSRHHSNSIARGSYFKDHLEIFSGKNSNTPLYYLPISDQERLRIDLENEIPNYHNPRIDKLFMANSIEARLPYLDPEVVETALSIPYSSQGITKKILRDAFREDLPREILEREKSALKIPYDDFVKNREVRQVLMQSKIFTREEVENLFSLPGDSRNKSRKIWLAYLSTIWYEQNFKN